MITMLSSNPPLVGTARNDRCVGFVAAPWVVVVPLFIEKKPSYRSSFGSSAIPVTSVDRFLRQPGDPAYEDPWLCAPTLPWVCPYRDYIYIYISITTPETNLSLQEKQNDRLLRAVKHN